MDSIISHSPEETQAFAWQLANSARRGDVFALCGDLGAGKTRFVKGFAAGLGCDPESVSSPTFSLIHEYKGGRLPLYHFDLYRLESATELLQIGFDDYLAGDGILTIEWADKFPNLLPSNTRWLSFRLKSGNEREILDIGQCGSGSFPACGAVLPPIWNRENSKGASPWPF